MTQQINISSMLDRAINKYANTSSKQRLYKENIHEDAANVLNQIKNQKQTINVREFLSEGDDQLLLRKIEDRIILKIDRENSWTKKSIQFYKDMESFILQLFKNNADKIFYNHEIAAEFKKSNIFKETAVLYPEIDTYFRTTWSKDLLQGNRKITDSVNNIKSDIRKSIYETPEKYGEFYIVRGKNPIENKAQSGWMYTSNKPKIKQELLRSGKTGTLRTLTNLRYGAFRKLIVDPGINVPELQKIEEAISRLIGDEEY